MMDYLAALKEGLREVYRAVREDPVVAERTRFCLIGFSASAQVLVPLCRLSEVAGLSVLTAGAATNFGAAFTFLRETIERDVEALASRFHRVYRPAVFFMSDGQPTDPATWPAAFAALTDPASRSRWPPGWRQGPRDRGLPRRFARRSRHGVQRPALLRTAVAPATVRGATPATSPSISGSRKSPDSALLRVRAETAVRTVRPARPFRPGRGPGAHLGATRRVRAGHRRPCPPPATANRSRRPARSTSPSATSSPASATAPAGIRSRL
jgi:hypothetical protein